MANGHLVSGGSKDRRLVFFDAALYPTNEVRELPELHGSVRTIIPGPGDMLLIGTTRNTILQPLVAVSRHGVYFPAFVYLDGRYIALGSRDNSIYVYQVLENGRKYSRVGRCSGHSSFVLHLDWSSDSQYLRSESGDYELLFWTAHDCRQVVSPSSLRDLDWATHTCTLSWSVVGIWPDGADGTDINACTVYTNSALLATADDHGKVKLFQYPANRPKVVSPSSLRDLDWATHTCTLSWSVVGIWPDGADGTDINACTVYTNSALLATADDHGKVKLFQYPANRPKVRAEPSHFFLKPQILSQFRLW
ncbi:hypothetical protein AHF37_09212 [Paragonimus kellicotti]|nr:hypothetical protein AHF37_09212 [Paragonimus kellicotti]